jgi:hypothetical protein
VKAPGEWAEFQLEVLEAGWKRIWDAVDRLGEQGLERPTSAGWTAKEMFAHIAFWEETATPVIQTMFREGAEVPIQDWYGGENLELAPDDPWPDANTHNAREARWARARSAEEVVLRLRKAQRRSIAVISSITDEEGAGEMGLYWSGAARCLHFDKHLAEIDFAD